MKSVHPFTLICRMLVFVLLLSSYAAVSADNVTSSAISTSSVVRVAVVNVRHLLQHAPQSEAASKELKKRFLSKEQELDAETEAIREFEESIRQSEGRFTREEKIEKKRELRSRKRTQNRALEDYREDLRLAKSEALDDVQKAVFEAIDEVRKRDKIDIVVQDFVSASERVDITETVILYLADKLKSDNLSKKVEEK